MHTDSFLSNWTHNTSPFLQVRTLCHRALQPAMQAATLIKAIQAHMHTIIIQPVFKLSTSHSQLILGDCATCLLATYASIVINPCGNHPACIQAALESCLYPGMHLKLMEPAKFRLHHIKEGGQHHHNCNNCNAMQVGITAST